MRTAATVELSSEQRQALERMARARSLPARVVERARVVLMAAEGLENKEIARRMNMTPEKAARWWNRFLAGGIEALERDAPRPGRTPIITERKVRRVVDMTCTASRPTPRTGRALARPSSPLPHALHAYRLLMAEHGWSVSSATSQPTACAAESFAASRI